MPRAVTIALRRGPGYIHGRGVAALGILNGWGKLSGELWGLGFSFCGLWAF